MENVNYPAIYRKRFFPEETILLDKDQILYYDGELMLTSWNTLKPRRDIARGVSAYFIEKGIKVSKVYDRYNQFVYWYCDIINTVADPAANKIVFEDLLVDVIIYSDESIHVADVMELADAYENNLFNKDMLIKALRTLARLLETIQIGEFSCLQKYVEDAEADYGL